MAEVISIDGLTISIESHSRPKRFIILLGSIITSLLDGYVYTPDEDDHDIVVRNSESAILFRSGPFYGEDATKEQCEIARKISFHGIDGFLRIHKS